MVQVDSQKIREVLEKGVEEIIERESLERKMKSGQKLRIKLGIDPTGPKIHLGRAIQFWKLRQFQELGHQAVLIIGDFTALIGDASDKTSMRRSLTEEEVKKNMKTYLKQIGLILDLKKTEIHYNSEWLGKLKLKDYLNLAMKFTAQQMIQRRNFKERWEKGNPIGVHELAYPIMQGYDSVAVKADVEIGGSDQLFNLKTGREIQKIFGQAPQDVMTLKMLYGLDGRKMSTSWGNTVNITDSPAEMYGKIMSMNDELIGHYFELAAQCSPKEVEEVKKELKSKKVNPREIKARLAKEIVRMYYGGKKAEKAEEEFNRVFRRKELPETMPFLKMQEKEIFLPRLLYLAGVASSLKEAKRLVKAGAVEIDGQKEDEWKKSIKVKNGMVIKVGKRRFVRIKTN